MSVVERNYQRAIEQIETTMDIFRNNYSDQGVDYRQIRTTEAYICFRHGYPRITSTQMNYKVAFAAANGGIPLSFSREKIL